METNIHLKKIDPDASDQAPIQFTYGVFKYNNFISKKGRVTRLDLNK